MMPFLRIAATALVLQAPIIQPSQARDWDRNYLGVDRSFFERDVSPPERGMLGVDRSFLDRDPFIAERSAPNVPEPRPAAPSNPPVAAPGVSVPHGPPVPNSVVQDLERQERERQRVETIDKPGPLDPVGQAVLGGLPRVPLQGIERAAAAVARSAVVGETLEAIREGLRNGGDAPDTSGIPELGPPPPGVWQR